MSGLIENIARMSLTASIVILVVLTIRALMKRFPRKYVYMIWAAVWFRLLCPVSIESRLSLFNLKPASEAASRVQNSKVYTQYVRSSAAERYLASEGYPVRVPEVSDVRVAVETTSHKASIDPHMVIAAVWLIVAAFILGYALFHLIRLTIRLRGARKIGRGLFESPLVDSPFAIGIFYPRIFLPTDLDSSEKDYLIAHERAHVRRGDLVFKALAVVALAVHWFNPLVWISFVLFCRDMEMSCDEIVLEKMGDDIRKKYSLSLVTLAGKNTDNAYVVMPTSFSKSSVGMMEVKMRIKNILNFKKSSKMMALTTVLIICSVFATCVLNACTVSEKKEEATSASSVLVSETSTEVTFQESAEEIEDPYAEEEFVSTDGELEDQLVYMVPKSDYPDSEREEYVRDVSDVSVFEDDDIRELASYYMDQGYQIFDQENQLSRHESLGDPEYMFKYGFNAFYYLDELEGDIWYCQTRTVWVYKMNEELFEYFIAGPAFMLGSFDKPRDTMEDDGTVIRYTDSYDGYVAEFDRETGICTLYIEEFTVSETGQMTQVDNDDIRDVALDRQEAGCDVWTFDPDDYYYYDLFYEEEYPYGYGIQCSDYSDPDPIDGSYRAGSSFTVFEADEELFESLAACGYWGEESSRDDDGTVITLTMADTYDVEDEDYSVTYTCTLSFDRDTNLMTITDESYEFI